MLIAMAKAKKNTWVHWSDEEVRLLRRLFPKGRASEIAERIGRPLTAVRSDYSRNFTQMNPYRALLTSLGGLWR